MGMSWEKRSIAFVTVMALLIATLAGCSSEKIAESESKEVVEVTTESLDTEESEAVVTEETKKEVTLKIYDWSDSTKARREEFNSWYMEQNPHVTIEYTVMTVDQFKSSVVSLISSGDAPDMFPVPTGMTLATAVSENWFAELDGLMDQEFLDTLEPEVFSEGVSMVDGKFYVLPDQQAITNALIFYNKDILAAAGLSVPTTYSEFIEACKKVTEIGNGQYFGLIEGGTQLNRLDVLLRSWTQVAGGKVAPQGSAITVNGRAPYDSDEMLGVFEVFAKLVDDGSIHPDTINISAPEARELFAQGQAAFLTQGAWCIAPWGASNPDLNYGVMAIPHPDNQETGFINGGEMGPWLGIYSQSKNKEEAANYMQALYSEMYQGPVVSDGGFVSIVKGMNDENMTNQQMLDYYNIAKTITVTAPNPAKVDKKVYDFYTKVVDVSPNLANIFQGLISGGVDDYESELKLLSERTTEEWKRAANEVGVDFSVFEFSNWDPSKNYTKEDYELR